MIFKEILKKQEPIVKEAVEELFNNAEKNQTHPQDILLILANGFYNEDFSLEFYKKTKLSPYVIGIGLIGFSEITQYKFYDWYRKSHIVMLSEFKKKLKDNKNLAEFEKISIHIEKNIYLKFWESDMILKKMLQLVNLANGKSYDWHLKIPVYARAREGSKQKIIRGKIRDDVKGICPKFYNIIKDTYLPQIRNAIAHSQFYFSERGIGYLNYSKDPKAHCLIRSLSFEDWATYFHNTILLYSELIKNFNKWEDSYYQKTIEKGYIEIRITKDSKTSVIKKLCVRDGYKDWVWLQ